MSRRQAETGGSLDLLLDTICNTFGGVVFIALLVVLLLRLSPVKGGSSSGHASALSAVVAQWENVLGNRYEALMSDARALANNESIDGGMDVIEALKELAEAEFDAKKQLGDALLSLGEVEQNLASTAERLDVIQANRIRVEKEHEHVAASVAVLEARQVSLRERLEKAKDLIPRPAILDRPLELPVERRDSNDQVTLFLKYGRLYFPFDRSGVNAREFMIKRGWVFNVAKPKPYEGIPVNSDGSSNNAIEQRLRVFPPGQFFLHLIVCEDSFAYFQGLKAHLSGLGYRYHLTPLQEGGSLWQTNSGPESSQ